MKFEQKKKFGNFVTENLGVTGGTRASHHRVIILIILIIIIIKNQKKTRLSDMMTCDHGDMLTRRHVQKNSLTLDSNWVVIINIKNQK